MPKRNSRILLNFVLKGIPELNYLRRKIGERGGMKSVVKTENIRPKFIQIKYIQYASGLLYFPRIPLLRNKN